MIEILKNRAEGNVIGFSATDSADKSPLGTISGVIEEGVYYVTEIETVPFLVDGMVRAAFNAAINAGAAKYAFRIEDKELLAALVRLGFVESDNSGAYPLVSFFENHKKCGKC